MRTRWTKEEMESVLIQLNNQEYLFKKYRFSRDENGIVILGSGGYANVYEMENVYKPEKKFAVKVLGFGERQGDSYEFFESVYMQQVLAANNNDVVNIIDCVELRVFFDASYQISKVFRLTEYDDQVMEGDYIKLQFILMEKLVPVLTMDKAGNPRLYPKALADFEENEIMKLAYNIGTALERAHENNFLHRDIKLENVFYDSKKKVYKLGDFGIAKWTEDGMASTVAYTKGYGAPETVGANDDRYDNTADIYSFGMMLYLLLNELKFPDSENYNVNVALQYTKGYLFPYPEREDYKLCSVLGGMCQYDPDDRFQSMKEALDHIEGIMIGEDIYYKKKNLKTSYVAGMVFFVVGMILWKLTHVPQLVLNIGIFGYAFVIACGYKYYLDLKNRDTFFLSFIVLGLGICFSVSTGFVWWKLIIVLVVSYFTGSISGLFSIGVFVVDILSRIMNHYPQIYFNIQQYRWMAVLLLSLSLVLLFQYTILNERDIQIMRMYFGKNEYWIIILIMYGSIFINGVQYRYMGTVNELFSRWFNVWPELVEKYDLFLIGICGMGFCTVWVIREKVLKKFS